MRTKDDKEKDAIKFCFSVASWKILLLSRYNSARAFALDIGMEPAHIQKIIRETRNVTITTIVSIVEGLELSMEEFGRIYDNINDEDLSNYRTEIKKQKV